MNMENLLLLVKDCAFRVNYGGDKYRIIHKTRVYEQTK